jgi:glutamate-1-semialdehyde 2,1-aminomutase
VYQAGTLSGNPLAMAAGIATLDALAAPGVWERAERFAAQATASLAAACARAGIPVTINRVGTMFTAFFTADRVTDYDSARRADRDTYARFFHAMLGAGVYLAPSAFEAAFTSAVHGEDELTLWNTAIDTAVGQLQDRRT